MSIGIYVLIVIVVLALIIVKKTIVIIPQSETKIIERLGRYYATLKPGINIIIPLSIMPRISFPSATDVIPIVIASICVSRFMISPVRM